MDFIIKESQKEFSQRQLETYEKYTQLIQWGRRDPVEFIRQIMGIEFKS